MWKGGKRAADAAREDALDHATGVRGGGGLLATVISAMALLFSGYSFYESVMRAPELAMYVPPHINYTDPDRPESPFEVFIIPLTIANDGARSGTVLSIDLEVTNPRKKETKKFYAAQLGTWGQQPVTSFAPISLSGKAAFSQAIQFFPRQGESIARVLDFEPGDYQFKVILNTASAGKGSVFESPVQPLMFEMQIGQLDYRNFNGSGTMGMWAADYKPAATKPE